MSFARSHVKLFAYLIYNIGLSFRYTEGSQQVHFRLHSVISSSLRNHVKLFAYLITSRTILQNAKSLLKVSTVALKSSVLDTTFASYASGNNARNILRVSLHECLSKHFLHTYREKLTIVKFQETQHSLVLELDIYCTV